MACVKAFITRESSVRRTGTVGEGRHLHDDDGRVALASGLLYVNVQASAISHWAKLLPSEPNSLDLCQGVLLASLLLACCWLLTRKLQKVSIQKATE
jgi:hypothetical protein